MNFNLLEKREDEIGDGWVYQEDKDQNRSSAAPLEQPLIGSVFDLPEERNAGCSNNRETAVENQVEVEARKSRDAFKETIKREETLRSICNRFKE